MGSGDDTGSGGAARGAVLKALVVVGGVLLLRRLRRSATRRDHAGAVADALSGEKVGHLDSSRTPRIGLVFLLRGRKSPSSF
jgi:hypothetical protein